MRKLGLLLVVTTAFGFTACDDDPLEPEIGLEPAMFDDFDANDDLRLNEDEFLVGFQDEDVFGDLDSDVDGFLSEDEFDADLGAFADFDANADTFLDEDEFVTGTFDVFDDDDDLFVDEDEFGVGVDLF